MPGSHVDRAYERLRIRDPNVYISLRNALDHARHTLVGAGMSLHSLEEAAGEEWGKQARAELAVRRAEIAWNQRHEATLEPLFRELDRQAEELGAAQTAAMLRQLAQ